jgi:hypothetical protein
MRAHNNSADRPVHLAQTSDKFPSLTNVLSSRLGANGNIDHFS